MGGNGDPRARTQEQHVTQGYQNAGGRNPSLYFKTVTLSGGVFSQAIESVTPEETCAQALVVAVRRANSSVVPEAVRQEGLP